MIRASMSGSPQNPWHLVRLLRGLDASVLHIHTGDSCIPRSASLALAVAEHPPTCVTIQSPFDNITPRSLRARLWVYAARRQVKAVVSPSDRSTAFQRRCGIPSELAVTIRNSVDLQVMGAGDGTGPRADLGLGPDDPLILFCSRIDSQKRPVDAVRIFAAVAAEFPSAVLAFVGRGDQETAVSSEAARRGLSSRVRILGYHTDIPNWLAAATVWLLPTERENFSVALLEALAAGCPVLATWCPGNDEILEDEKNALTFPVGDIETGAVALRRLLRSRSLRAILREGALAAAREHSLPRMVDRYQELYRRCISPASHPRW